MTTKPKPDWKPETKSVPREATLAMIQAVINRRIDIRGVHDNRGIWAAMWDAAEADKPTTKEPTA